MILAGLGEATPTKKDVTITGVKALDDWIYKAQAQLNDVQLSLNVVAGAAILAAVGTAFLIVRTRVKD